MLVAEAKPTCSVPVRPYLAGSMSLGPCHWGHATSYHSTTPEAGCMFSAICGLVSSLLAETTGQEGRGAGASRLMELGACVIDPLHTSQLLRSKGISVSN